MTDTETPYLERPELLFPLLEGMSEAVEDDVDEIVSLLTATGGERPASVLDVGCGIGNYAVPFAQRGLATTGLDITPEYLDRARERARAAGVADRTDFVERDMRALDDLPGTYDAAVCITAFGYFDDETNERLLRAIHDRLTPGGTLLLNVANKERWLVTRRHDADSVIPVGEDHRYARRRRYDPLDSRLYTTTHVLEGDSYRGRYEYDRRLYTPVEYRRLLERAGFGAVRLLTGYDGEALTDPADELVVVGRKRDRA